MEAAQPSIKTHQCQCTSWPCKLYHRTVATIATIANIATIATIATMVTIATIATIAKSTIALQ